MISKPPNLARGRYRGALFAAAVLAAAMLLPAPGPRWVAQEVAEEAGEASAPEVVRATLESAAGHREVREVRRLVAGGGRVDWSRQGDVIAFDKLGADERQDVYTIPAEGGAETCVTCDNLDFKRLSAFNPSWHPSGEYLVFQVQSLAKRLAMGPERLATPSRGLHCELWMATREGRPAWQLTRAGESGGAVLDPHFSYEGTQLVWSERLASRSAVWGEWGLRLAGFEIKRGLPRLSKVRTLEPGERKGLVVAHGFTPDDRGLLLSGSPLAGQRESELDLFTLDVASGSLEPLLVKRGELADLPRFVPAKELVVFASSRGLEPGDQLPYRQDLWLMSLDGRRQERLTYFNDPSSTTFLEEAMIADIAFSPQGDRLAVSVVHADSEVRQTLYLVVLDASYRR